MLDDEEDRNLNGRVDADEMDPRFAFINSIEPEGFDPGHLRLDFNEVAAGGTLRDQYAGMGLATSGTDGYDGMGEMREPVAVPDSLNPTDKYLCRPGPWEDLTSQSYIFTISGLNVSQVGIQTFDG
jgi:hypothetical protein